MWAGQLRYPGGTVANYWYLPNATYVEPCAGDATFRGELPGEVMCEAEYADLEAMEQSWNYYTYGCRNNLGGQCYTAEEYCDADGGVWHSSGYCGSSTLGIACGCCAEGNRTNGDQDTDDGNAYGVADTGSDEYEYDYCDKKANVDAFPPGTFSATRFVQGVGSASPVTDSRGVVFDLNVLTVNEDDMLAQLEALRTEADMTGFPVSFLEFGNEFFMSGHYGDWFATAHDYIHYVRPALARARELFPEAKLAVPAGYRFCGGEEGEFTSWNEALAEYGELFDAVTIHEYTACTKSVDDNATYAVDERRSALAAWGEVQLSTHAAWVASFFGDDKEIWMTEWSYASWSGVPLQDEEDFDADAVVCSGITGIYKASFLLAAVARSQATSAPHTAMHCHLFNEQEGNGWGSNAGSTRLSEDGSIAYINGAGQIISHIAYVALQLSDQMRPVAVAGGPLLNFSVQGSANLSCVYAAAFEHSCRAGALPVYAIINRCSYRVNVTLDVSSAEAGTKLRTVSYDSYAPGDWTNVEDLPAGFAHPWTDVGPISPQVLTRDLGEGEEELLRLELGSIALTVVEFDQPAFNRTALAATCCDC
eukprot:gene4911-5993_t